MLFCGLLIFVCRTIRTMVSVDFGVAIGNCALFYDIFHRHKSGLIADISSKSLFKSVGLMFSIRGHCLARYGSRYSPNGEG